MRRSDSESRTSERTSSRVFQRSEGWFVRTREGLRGPFASKSAAEHEASAYAQTMEFLETHSESFADPEIQEVEIVNMNRPCWG